MARLCDQQSPKEMDRNSFLRRKLQGTTLVVTAARYVIDSCNMAIYAIQRPFCSAINRVAREASWMLACGGTATGILIPALLYPYFSAWVTPDNRRLYEQERIRKSLQQGLDPHPYLKHRESTYGINMPYKAIDETQVPATASEEFRVMSHYRTKVAKEALDRRNAELAAIAALEGAASTGITGGGFADAVAGGRGGGASGGQQQPLPPVGLGIATAAERPRPAAAGRS